MHLVQAVAPAAAGHGAPGELIHNDDLQAGRQWQAVAGNGRQWQAVAGSGRQWQAVAGGLLAGQLGSSTAWQSGCTTAQPASQASMSYPPGIHVLPYAAATACLPASQASMGPSPRPGSRATGPTHPSIHPPTIHNTALNPPHRSGRCMRHP